MAVVVDDGFVVGIAAAAAAVVFAAAAAFAADAVVAAADSDVRLSCGNIGRGRRRQKAGCDFGRKRKGGPLLIDSLQSDENVHVSVTNTRKEGATTHLEEFLHPWGDAPLVSRP